jgi:hypothetical protein
MNPFCSSLEAGVASHPIGEAPQPHTCEMRPRLTKGGQNVLEQLFKVQQKPNKLVKDRLAFELGVPFAKINASDDPPHLQHVYDMLIRQQI